jgi:hypothetical protein
LSLTLVDKYTGMRRYRDAIDHGASLPSLLQGMTSLHSLVIDRYHGHHIHVDYSGDKETLVDHEKDQLRAIHYLNSLRLALTRLPSLTCIRTNNTKVELWSLLSRPSKLTFMHSIIRLSLILCLRVSVRSLRLMELNRSVTGIRA